MAVRSYLKVFCVYFEFQGAGQPTRTENNPTDFCGGTAQLNLKTGVPSRGQRVLLTQNEFSRKYSARQASRACGASHPSRTFGKSLEVMILYRHRGSTTTPEISVISSTNLPEIYRQSLVRRPVFSLVRLLVRPWPYRVAPAAGDSFGAHICPMFDIACLNEQSRNNDGHEGSSDGVLSDYPTVYCGIL